MVKDRMKELQAQLNQNTSDANGGVLDTELVDVHVHNGGSAGAAVYVRTNTSQPNGGQKNMGFQNDNNNASGEGGGDLDDFFGVVDDMRNNIETMKTKSAAMKKLTADLLLQTDDTKLELERELDGLVADVKKIGRRVKNDLGLVESTYLKDFPRAGVEGRYVPAEERIKKMHYTMISKEFCDTMNEINLIQTNYQEKLKEKMVRQLAVMNPDGTDYTSDQINEMIQSGKTSIWTQNLLRETEDAKQKLNAVQARHEEIIKLEKSIMEVHEMFLDLAVLVESQGALVNNIEDNVLKTSDYMRTAVVDLEKAAESKRAFNKKRFICAGILIVVVLIVILIICAELGAFEGSSSSSPDPKPSPTPSPST